MLHIRGLLCVALLSVLFQVNCYQEEVNMDDLVAAIATAAMNGAIPFNFLNVNHRGGGGKYMESVRIPVLLIKQSDLIDRPLKFTAKYQNGFRNDNNFKGQGPYKRFPVGGRDFKDRDYAPKPKYPTTGLRIVPAPKLVAPDGDLKPVSNRPIYENSPRPAAYEIRANSIGNSPRSTYENYGRPQEIAVPKPPIKPQYDDDEDEEQQPVVGKSKTKIPERYLKHLPPLPEGVDSQGYDTPYGHQHQQHQQQPQYSQEEGSTYKVTPVVRHKIVNLGDVYRNPADNQDGSSEEQTGSSEEQSGSSDENFDGYAKTQYDSQLVSTLKKLMTNNNNKEKLNLNVGGQVYQTEPKGGLNSPVNSQVNGDYYQTESQSVENTNDQQSGEHFNTNTNINSNNVNINTNANIGGAKKYYYRPPITRLITNNNHKTYVSAPIVHTRETLISPQQPLQSSSIPQSFTYSSPQSLPYNSQPSSFSYNSPQISPYSQTTTQAIPQIPQYLQPVNANIQSLAPIQEYSPRVPESYLRPYTQTQQTQVSTPIQSYSSPFISNSNSMSTTDSDDGYTQIVHLLPGQGKSTRQRIAVPIDLSNFGDKQLSQSSYYVNDVTTKLSPTQSYAHNPTPDQQNQQTIQTVQQTSTQTQNADNSYVVTGVYRQQIQDQDNQDDSKNADQVDQVDDVEQVEQEKQSYEAKV